MQSRICYMDWYVFPFPIFISHIAVVHYKPKYSSMNHYQFQYVYIIKFQLFLLCCQSYNLMLRIFCTCAKIFWKSRSSEADEDITSLMGSLKSRLRQPRLSVRGWPKSSNMSPKYPKIWKSALINVPFCSTGA